MSLDARSLRMVGRTLIRMRATLQAVLVQTLKQDNRFEPTPEVRRLQKSFEDQMKTLPIWLRSERFIAKHVVSVAERELHRRGILAIAKDQREDKVAGRWVP